MKKRNILSLFLATSLVVSCIPAGTVHATDVNQQLNDEQTLEQNIGRNDGSSSENSKDMTLDEMYAFDSGKNMNYFVFTPEESNYYEFGFTGTGVPYAELYSSNFNQLATSGSGNNFKIVEYLEAGESYYLEVTNDEPDEELYVYVTISTEEPDAPSTQFDPSKAESIEVDTEYDTELPDGDYCYYSFTPEVDSYYRFESFGDEDTYAILYDSDFYDIATDDDSGYGRNFKIVHYLYEDETYYLAVREYGFEYGKTVVSVKMTDEDPDSPDEPENIDPTIATKMQIGNDYEVKLGSGEYSWFAFKPEKTWYYIFSSDSEDDPAMILYDDEGYEEDFDDNGGYGNNFRLKRKLYKGWTYYIKVYGNGDSLDATVRVDLSTDFQDYSRDRYATIKYNEDAVLSVDVARFGYDPSLASYQWYQWIDGDEVLIAGATKDTYVVNKDLIANNEDCYYSCVITINGESCTEYFNIKKSDTLKILYEGSPCYGVSEIIDDTIELNVSGVTCTSNSIDYKWYGVKVEYSEDDDADYEYNIVDRVYLGSGSSYMMNINTIYPMYSYFECEISDGITSETVEIDPYIEKVANENSYYTIKCLPGEKVVLGENITDKANQTYQWDIFDSDLDEYKTIEGAVNRTLEVTAPDSIGEEVVYQCYINDHQRILYTLVTQAFNVDYQEEYYRFTKENVELSVKTESDKDYHYQWYRGTYEYLEEDDDIWPELTYKAIPGANEETYLVEGDSYEEYLENSSHLDYYRCEISDGDNIVNADMSVFVFSTLASYGETISVSDVNQPKPITIDVQDYSGEIRYQWQMKAPSSDTYVDIVGETSDTYVPKDLTPGRYIISCLVEDDYSRGRRDYTLYVMDTQNVSIIQEEENFVDRFDFDEPVLVKFVADESANYTIDCDSRGEYSLTTAFFNEDFEYIDQGMYIPTKKGNTYYCLIEPTYYYNGVGDYIYLTHTPISEEEFEYPETVAALIGEDVILSVTPLNDKKNYSYEWCYNDKSGNEIVLVNEKGNTIKVSAADYESPRYSRPIIEMDFECNVFDGTDIKTLNMAVYFLTLIVNEPDNSVIKATAGEKVTFSVNARSSTENIHYAWFREAGNRERVLIPDEHSATLTRTMTFDKKLERYTCEVSNGIISQTVPFSVYPIKGDSTDPVDPPVDPVDPPVVEPTELNDGNVSLSETSFIYDGSEKKPEVNVVDGEKKLVEGTDYEVAYSNNKEAGTAKVTVTGLGNYTGTVEKTFEIQKINLSNCKVSISKTSYIYDGAEKKPEVNVADGEKKLVEGTDYEVAYSNNKEAGTAKVTVTGLGNYTGTVKKTFTILLATPEFTAVANKTTGVKLSWNAVEGATNYRVLRKTTDGTWETLADTTDLTYTDTTVASGKTYTYSLVCVNEDGSKELSKYNETGKSIRYLSSIKASVANKSTGITVSWPKVTGAKGYYVYRKTGTGSFSKIKTITSGSTLSYSDTAVKTKNGTKYTYCVKAYSGSTTGSYTSKTIYRLTGKSISSLSNVATRRMLVKWTKDTKATGYQIQYSTSSTFASGNKTVSVTSNSTVSKYITSLTKGKKYYVRLRTYKTVSGTKYYSAWSSKKYVTITK